MNDMIKQYSFSAADRLANGKMLNVLERKIRKRRNQLAVLTYHRVAEPGATPNLDPGLISASPPQFAEQMEYLATRCHVVSLHEVLEVRRTGKTLRPRSVRRVSRCSVG